MTNLLATFQTIINKILRDLINKEKVIAFVDNMLVGTKTKKEHNEIIEEILKRLEENNLYIKPEKYVWRLDSQRLLQNLMKQKWKKKKWIEY